MKILCYPTSVENPNVPADAFLVAEVPSPSQCLTLRYTYFITRDGHTKRVGNWNAAEPSPAPVNALCKLLGETEDRIASKWDGYFENRGGTS